MFKFKTSQKQFNIYGVEIGSHRGELPMVLIGNIFYSGDKIVSDPIKGFSTGRRPKTF